MNLPRNHGHLFFWLAATLLITSFALGDAAVVIWSASLATFGQLAAGQLAFLLTGAGVLFTIWQIRR